MLTSIEGASAVRLQTQSSATVSTQTKSKFAFSAKVLYPPYCVVIIQGSVGASGSGAWVNGSDALSRPVQCGGLCPSQQGSIDDIARSDGVHAGSDQCRLRCATREAEKGKACKAVSNAVRAASQCVVAQNMAAWDSHTREERSGKYVCVNMI